MIAEKSTVVNAKVSTYMASNAFFYLTTNTFSATTLGKNIYFKPPAMNKSCPY